MLLRKSPYDTNSHLKHKQNLVKLFSNPEDNIFKMIRHLLTNKQLKMEAQEMIPVRQFTKWAVKCPEVMAVLVNDTGFFEALIDHKDLWNDCANCVEQKDSSNIKTDFVISMLYPLFVNLIPVEYNNKYQKSS